MYTTMLLLQFAVLSASGDPFDAIGERFSQMLPETPDGLAATQPSHTEFPPCDKVIEVCKRELVTLRKIEKQSNTTNKRMRAAIKATDAYAKLRLERRDLPQRVPKLLKAADKKIRDLQREKARTETESSRYRSDAELNRSEEKSDARSRGYLEKIRKLTDDIRDATIAKATLVEASRDRFDRLASEIDDAATVADSAWSEASPTWRVGPLPRHQTADLIDGVKSFPVIAVEEPIIQP